MKVVVVGGSGLIGTKLVAMLSAGGHEVVANAQLRTADVAELSHDLDESCRRLARR